MPVTIKQMEAFHAVATLGSVVAAADHLSLVQSTVSKRLVELEAVIGAPLFERGPRTVLLTRRGQSVLSLAAEMLRLEAQFREEAGGPIIFRGRFRFGVTELVALSWLPRLIVAMKEAFPDVVPVPEVEASVALFEKLADRRLDLVIGLDPPPRLEFRPLPLASVQLQWMCAPGFGPEEDEVPLERMAEYPILTQGSGSGLQRLVLDWLGAEGLQINRVVQCNSPHVLAELAAAGLGITFLTEDFFRRDVESGRLRLIRTIPRIPPIQYFAVIRADVADPLAHRIAQTARRICDFSARRLAP